MLDKLAGIEARYDELNRLMAEGAAPGSDYAKMADYARERSGLEELYNAAQTYRALLKDLAGARALLDDASMADLAAEEVKTLEAQQTALEARLRLLLIP